jgi:hypothetical protein
VGPDTRGGQLAFAGRLDGVRSGSLLLENGAVAIAAAQSRCAECRPLEARADDRKFAWPGLRPVAGVRRGG